MMTKIIPTQSNLANGREKIQELRRLTLVFTFLSLTMGLMTNQILLVASTVVFASAWLIIEAIRISFEFLIAEIQKNKL